MNDTIHRENAFETYITRRLAKLQSGGWKVSDNDQGFDAGTALYMPDFLEFFRNTAKKKVEKMQISLGANWSRELQNRLVRSLEENGTILTLRNGFQMAGYQTIDCSKKAPDDPRITDAAEMYSKNILRVMRQVRYQTAGNKSLDLVFFVNGIPVATAELKTELTQTVQDAIKEYQTERKPIEPGTRRKNYLLMFKRGAVVHFAISEDEVWMCTHIDSDKPRFLPFNKGNGCHAGNPPAPDGDYKTDYFWDLICQRDNWLNIFQKFVFEEVNKKEDATGRLREVRTQIFPRFHQWDCVTKLMADVRKQGAGKRYLIEHSAGSGKTETISWTAHDLTNIRNANGEKLFSSVIIVTDRLSLDTNIKATIKQLKKLSGLIEMIGRDDNGKRTSDEAKGKQLTEALANRREIVVVTLQTFFRAWDSIAHSPSLEDRNFAVIIDEAHNSQTGSNAAALRAALSAAGNKELLGTEIPEDMTDEDAISEYFKKMQKRRVMPPNVSFFAFTATPKGETRTLFGTPGEEIDPKTGDPIPESFHLYSMRQAIEEGYIIDPLTGYMPYSTAYKLAEDVVPEVLVDPQKAVKTIAKWASLHPTNVMEKTQFIIEHFVKNVATLLEGQAKAMIVTASRPSVIRYKYAIQAYLKAHPEYDRSKIAEHLQFKVPGDPLVAFSDSVRGDKCLMKEDEYLKPNPFAAIKKDYDYTEENMNNLGNEMVQNAFDRPEYRLLIVANKFQTGFDQPKLCALYIDKSLSNDIEIVQTYSRVNRIHSGKDRVFIIDFVNDPKTVLRAFKIYDEGAHMEKAQNRDVIYQVKKDLDDAEIYTPDEFEAYKKARYAALMQIQQDKDKQDACRKMLYKSVEQPAERWQTQYEIHSNSFKTWQGIRQDAETRGESDLVKQADLKIAEEEKELEKLVSFRKQLKRFDTVYSFVSQIVDLEDPDLEVFLGFSKLLLHKLHGSSIIEIDVGSLILSDYRISKKQLEESKGKASLKPIGPGGKGRVNKQESLRKIIAKLNETWGEDVDPVMGATAVNYIVDRVVTDNVTRTQIENSTNSKQAVLSDGRLKSIITKALLAMINNEMADLALHAVKDTQSLVPLAEQVYDLIAANKRYDIKELQDYLKDFGSRQK